MGRENCKILALLLCTWLASCVKDKPAANTIPPSTSGKVYVVCEGNFGNGDATLYNYNSTNNTVFGDLYSATNNQPLGDVFESMKRMGDSLYLCVNNSDKVVVISASDHKLAGIINIPKSRYILPVSPDKAYVSTLYSNKVYIINPRTLQVTATTDLPHKNPEGMCIQAGNIFVCPWDTVCNKIYKIDALTGSISQTIQVGSFAPHAVLVDKEQMLWVLSGNIAKNRAAALTRIDPSTGNILKTYTFPANADPIKPVFNNTKDTLYFIGVRYDGSTDNNGIYRMAIHSASLPATPFIQGSQYQYFWALGIDPVTGNIYVGDPKGFTQKGSVSVYKQDGTLTTTFNVGLGPGQFYFGD